MNDNLKTKLDEFISLKKEENEKYFLWLRNIIGMAIAFLGILVSFKSKDETSLLTHLVFSISISLISLGIISGTILLFTEIKWLREEIKIKSKWMSNLLKGGQNNFEIVEIPIPWYIKPLKIACYFSFIFSLVFISIYTFLT